MDALWQQSCADTECKGDCTWCNRHPTENSTTGCGELERRCADLQQDKSRLQAQVRALRTRLEAAEGRPQPNAELRH